jgi:predicted chitinase
VAAAFTMALVGCLGGQPSDEPDVDNDSAAVTCNYAGWQRGASYRTGDIVMYNGSPYIAEHDNPGYDPTISTWFWEPYASNCSDGTGSDGTTDGSTGGGDGFRAIVSESQFNAMFPSRSSFYTYQALASAASTFSEFATTGDTTTRKREMAAFLANVEHETGGLVYIEEINKATYCDTSWGPPGCGCAAGKQYFGRGPLQISWNGNYCSAGNALGVDLMNDPDRVARDATVAWRTGLWFWNTQTGAGRMTAHNAIVTGAGFGETIRTINGALECDGKNTAQMQSRIDAYKRFTSLLGVSPGSNEGC